MDKKVIIAAVAIALLLAVFLAFLLGDSFVKMYWKQQCRSVYEQIRSTGTVYYTAESDTFYASDGRNSSYVLSCWIDGDDYFERFDGKHVDSCEVKLCGVGYEIDDKGRKPNSNIEPTNFWRNADWGKFAENKSISVATVDGGNEVSFFKDYGWGNCLTQRQTGTYIFCFDENGDLSTVKFLRITYNGMEIDPRNIYCTDNIVYTFRSFDRDEIRTTIEDAFSRLAP